MTRVIRPGAILDPFAGSGSTLVAAIMEGFDAVGIEREAEYVSIAEQRIDGVQAGFAWEGPHSEGLSDRGDEGDESVPAEQDVAVPEQVALF